MDGLVICFNTAAVRFDERAAYSQSHAHAVWLGREEAVEQASQVLRGDAGATVLDRATERQYVGRGGPDRDLALSDRTLLHCLDGVDDKIDDNLLELNRISKNHRRVGGLLA